MNILNIFYKHSESKQYKNNTNKVVKVVFRVDSFIQKNIESHFVRCAVMDKLYEILSNDEE